jgi:predicted DNA binding CopG/RHH family protein
MEKERPNGPKDRRITVRLSVAEYAALQEEARKHGTTVGAALRLLIRELRPKQKSLECP